MQPKIVFGAAQKTQSVASTNYVNITGSRCFVLSWAWGKPKAQQRNSGRELSPAASSDPRFTVSPFSGGVAVRPGMAMLLRRRLPLLRLLRPLHTESAASTSSSSTPPPPPPPFQKPHAAAVEPGSRRLRFPNATPVESVRGASKLFSTAAYLALGAAAALASLPVAFADSNEQVLFSGFSVRFFFLEVRFA